MLQIIPQDVVLERLDQLPFELKERLLSPEFGSLVREICSLHHLDDRKADLVLTLAGDVLFGFSYIQDFPRALAEEAPVDQRLATTISQEIREKLFAPVEEEIKKHYKPYVEPLVSRPLQETAGVGKKLPIALESERQGERPSIFQKEEEGKQKIVINPALLRMQKDSGQRTKDSEQRTEDKGLKTQDKSTNNTNTERLTESSENKPFVLFEQKGAEAPKKRGKGFSMPFGFFKEKPGSSRTPAPGEAVRASVQGPKSRVVHYSGERTQVTPFAQEEELFEVKDRGQRTENLGQRTSLKVEEPAKSGEVQIKKNPFSFPGLQQNAKSDGKPKLEGNVISLK